MRSLDAVLPEVPKAPLARLGRGPFLHPAVEDGQRARFHRIVHDQSHALTEVGEALAAYFDKADESERVLTPTDEAETAPDGVLQELFAIGDRLARDGTASAARTQLFDLLPTLSDGTAGGVEAGAITFPLCQRVVDDALLVDEAAIADALRLMLDRQQLLLEGAAGVAVAGFLADAPRLAGRNVVIVACGANIGLDTLRAIL